MSAVVLVGNVWLLHMGVSSVVWIMIDDAYTTRCIHYIIKREMNIFRILADDMEEVISLDLENENEEESEDDNSLTPQPELTDEDDTKEISDPQGPETKVKAMI